MTERLNRVLARAGVASRRQADLLISQGRVSVNGTTVDQLGTRVDPHRDAIRVDGRRIAAPQAHFDYYMLHKPGGVVTTRSDPEGRTTVVDLVRDRVRSNVFPVGRLDYHSEGLLLLTNDGELAHRLTHPSSAVAKTYAVKVHGRPGREQLERLRGGVRVGGRRTLPAQVRMTRPADNSWLEVTVTEGRKHQVRLMCDAIGHRVMRLRRIRYDGLELGDLPRGTVRPLREAEVVRLREAVRGKRKST